MGDVLALFVGTFACLVAFVVRTARADARGHGSSGMDWGGRLLLATAALSVVAAVWLFWLRLFSG